MWAPPYQAKGWTKLEGTLYESLLWAPPSAHLMIGECLEETITENPLLVSPSSFLFILIIFILQILPEWFARKTCLKKKKMFEQ